jgi:hypothetical protein
MTLIARAAAAWQRWLFAPGSLRHLALFRIGWALAMLLAARHEAGLWQLYSAEQYHAPWFGWAQPLSQAAFQRLTQIAEIGSALALIGLWPKLGCALVIATLGYLFASDALLFRNHIYLGLWMGLLLCASPCGRARSVEACWHRWRGRGPAGSAESSGVATQLIKAQVLFVYGFSALNKLRLAFLDGYTLQQELPFALRSSPLRALFCDARGAPRPVVENALHNALALSVCSCSVVLVEGFLVFGLPSRRLRHYAIPLGLSLHASIFLLMDIRVFGLLMVAAYPLFSDSDARRNSFLLSVGKGNEPLRPFV